MWHSVDIVDSERASYWTPGEDTVPAAETWDLYGGRHDGEPSFVPSVHLYLCVRVCVCVCDEREKEREDVRASVRESSEEYSLIMAVWRGEGVTMYHCLPFGQQPSEV